MFRMMPARMGYGGDPSKVGYEITQGRTSYADDSRPAWGREHHATSAAGWHCPVLFIPYSELGWKARVRDLDLFAIGGWWTLRSSLKYWLYRRWVGW